MINFRVVVLDSDGISVIIAVQIEFRGKLELSASYRLFSPNLAAYSKCDLYAKRCRKRRIKPGPYDNIMLNVAKTKGCHLECRGRQADAVC